MKLFSKIFLSIMLILTLALSVQEYAVISYSFQGSIEREREDGADQFRLLRYALQSTMVRRKQSEELSLDTLQNVGKEIGNLVPDDCKMELYCDMSDEYYLLYSSTGQDQAGNIKNLENGKIYTGIEKNMDEYFLNIEGKVSQAGFDMVLIMKKNVTDVFQSKHELERASRILYMVILAGAAVLCFVVSYFITRPIRKLQDSTGKIADGDYGERVQIRTRDEIGELGQNFNQMAEKIQENMEKIQLEAEKKEQFVSDFAHELKTPLTSIIGYADRIYQSDMDREETKKA